MTRPKILLNAFRAAGLVSFLILAMIKIPPAWNPLLGRLCPDRMEHGDMYRETMIARFKIRLPDEVGPALTRTESARAGDYRVFALGDSFMPFRRGHENFVQTLSSRLDAPIFYEGWDVPDPTCLFKRLDAPVTAGQKRIVVMESVERLIVDRLSEPRPCPGWMVEHHRAYRSPGALIQRLYELTFADNEKSLRAFFCYNRLTFPLMERLFTLRFAATGAIDSSPVYSLHPPFLFFYQETTPGLTTSFYYPHDPALVRRIADNIARIRDELKAEDDAELVFLPVPDKYTVYHTLVNRDPYDGFLIRLADELDKRGVRNVRLYEKYRSTPELTYFPTDLHWNPLGLSIAVDETLKALHGRAPSVARK